MAFLKSARVTLASLAVLCLGTIAAPAANAYSPDIDGDGIPTSVQLIGRPFDEATLLALSHQIEAARPWAGRRPPVD